MTLPPFPPPDTDGPAPGPDVAYTPDPLADAIVAALLPHLPQDTTLADPHAGGGAFLRAFAKHRSLTYGAELDPAAARFLGVPCADFLSSPRPCAGDLAYIGNPPFEPAGEHLVHALSHDPALVAWILPAGWATRTKTVPAAAFTHPVYGCPTAWPFVGRASYGGPGREEQTGTAMTDNVVFVWSRATIRPQRIFWR